MRSRDRARARLRGMVALVAVAGGSLALVVAGATAAAAHASLVSTSPIDGSHVDQSPPQVTLQFDEHVAADLGGVRVFSTDGTRVDQGDVATGPTDGEVRISLQPNLADGTYVVAWSVVSADSHPIHGAFTFIVGAGPAASDNAVASVLHFPNETPWQIAGGVARFLSYVGVLLAAGGIVFIAVVEPDLVRRPGIGRLLGAGAAIGGLGLFLTVPVQAALATGLGWHGAVRIKLWADVLHDGYRGGTVGGLLGLAGVVMVLGAVGRAVPPHPVAAPTDGDDRADTEAAPAPIEWPRWFTVAAIGSAAVALGSFALIGHSRTTDPRWLGLGADSLHVAAAGVWFGGLVLMIVSLREHYRVRSLDRAAIVVDRFSALAGIAVAALAVGGFAMGWAEVRTLHNLFSTAYGRTLLVKVGVAGIVALAAIYNHFKLVPRVRVAPRVLVPAGPGAAVAGTLEQPADRGFRTLSKTLRIEVVGLLVAIGLTSALVNLTPARNAGGVGKLFSTTASFGTGEVNLVVDPARVGTNNVHVYLLDRTGRPAASIQNMTFRFSLPAKNLGPIDRTPFVAGPGHYQLTDDVLSVPGQWQVEVVGQVSQFDEARTTISFPVRG